MTVIVVLPLVKLKVALPNSWLLWPLLLLLMMKMNNKTIPRNLVIGRLRLPAAPATLEATSAGTIATPS